MSETFETSETSDTYQTVSPPYFDDGLPLVKVDLERRRQDLSLRLAFLHENCQITPHTRPGRLFTTVKRMKAEEELAIPIVDRYGGVSSAALGLPAHRMSPFEWGVFYMMLADQLHSDYPELYTSLENEPDQAG